MEGNVSLAPTTQQPSDTIYLSSEELKRATPAERTAYYRYLKRELWRRDPVAWGEQRLGEHYWSKQVEIMRAVQVHRRVAVRSCHDVGKSFTVARIVAHFIDTNPPGSAFAVTSAPTFSQVRGILWREIGQAHRKGKLVGRVNLTEWFIGPEIVGFGRKPSDADPTAFQGIHAPKVLVVLDEACGIPESLWDAASTLVTNEASRIVAIGNPDEADSHFASVCAPGSGWHVIGIDAFESPNFTGEDVPEDVRRVLISPTWVDEKRLEWGEDSPLWISKVRGQFPEDSTDGIVPYSWVQKCRSEPTSTVRNPADPVELGVDVGAGGDETVVRERVGMRVGRTWRFRHDDAMRSVGEIVEVIRETGATAVKVDVIGVGFGIHGRLKELADDGELDCDVVGINVGEKANDPARFKNRKAELWWEIGRELSRAREWDLSEVDDQTVAELVAHRYTLDSSGRIKVEGKDEVRKRLGRSPDNADALILAFASQPLNEPVFLGVA